MVLAGDARDPSCVSRVRPAAGAATAPLPEAQLAAVTTTTTTAPIMTSEREAHGGRRDAGARGGRRDAGAPFLPRPAPRRWERAAVVIGVANGVLLAALLVVGIEVLRGGGAPREMPETAVDVDGTPAMGVDGAPAMGVDGTPAMGVDGAPAMGVDGAPAVGVDGAPAVGVDGAPASRRPSAGEDAEAAAGAGTDTDADADAGMDADAGAGTDADADADAGTDTVAAAPPTTADGRLDAGAPSTPTPVATPEAPARVAPRAWRRARGAARAGAASTGALRRAEHAPCGATRAARSQAFCARGTAALLSTSGKSS
jgi:hypothetical protein